MPDQHTSTANSKGRYAVGIMSGTSLDGVDAALCRIRPRNGDATGIRYAVQIESFTTTPYPPAFRETILDLCDEDTGTVDVASRTNIALAELFADAVLAVCDDTGVPPEDVAVVGSHGQTVWHAPEPEPVPGLGRTVRSTLQLGAGSVIAARTSIPTVSDFRPADIAVGGRGAPLTPFYDLACLTAPDEKRALQNNGGIGNCTLLPPGATHNDVVAFDTGPGNMLIDAIVSRLTDGVALYDEDGVRAARGAVDDSLISSFLDDPYFARKPPKTTGREQFGDQYADRFIADARARGCRDDDIVASATALTARSIADAYERFADPYPDRIFVSGGGANNPTLLTMLDTATAASVERSTHVGVDPDAKEAAVFALLGLTTLDGVPNNVPAATGATRSVTLGAISHP